MLKFASLSAGNVFKARRGIVLVSLLLLFDQYRITSEDQLLPGHSLLVKRVELLVHFFCNLSRLLIKTVEKLAKHLVVECSLISQVVLANNKTNQCHVYQVRQD